MELELTTLAHTLAVGAIGLSGLVFLLGSVCSRLVPGFLDFSSENPKAEPHKIELLSSALIFGLVWGIGILFEGYSKEYTAERMFERKEDYSESPTLLDKYFGFFLKPDVDLRLRSLLTITNMTSTNLDAFAKPIFCSLVEATNLDLNLAKSLDTITNKLRWLKGSDKIELGYIHIDEGPELSKFKKAIDEVYHVAKNRTFRETNYYSELTDIENRINFARAIVLLTALLLIGCVGCSLWIGFYLALNTKKGRGPIPTIQRTLGSLLSLLVICIVSSLLFGSSYRAEHTNFDLRAVGYYLSLKQDPPETQRGGDNTGPAKPIKDRK